MPSTASRPPQAPCRPWERHFARKNQRISAPQRYTTPTNQLEQGACNTRSCAVDCATLSWTTQTWSIAGRLPRRALPVATPTLPDSPLGRHVPQLSTPSRLRAGPLLMMCAVASFTGMVACVKLVRIDLDAIEVMWWRSLIGVPLIALVAARGGSLRIHRRGLLLLRALFGFGAMGCYFTAAKGLSLADLSLISRSQPMIIAIIAPLLLGRAERPHRGTWLVMLVGLVGCAVLLAPGLSLGSTWGLWALGAASFAAIAHTIVRALGATERPAAVVFWFQVLVALFALVVLVTTRGALPPVPAQAHWLPLAGVGLFAVLGQWLMTRAYQVDQAARVAAASYVGPLWAALVDIALFATLPGWHALVGGSLIVGAGVALALRRPSG